jgi:hypothetical protein
MSALGTFSPRAGLLDEAVCGRAGPKGFDRQRWVPDAGPRPAMAAVFEFCVVAVERPARCDQPRLVLEAREGKEHLVVDQDQASVSRLGAALETPGTPA